MKFRSENPALKANLEKKRLKVLNREASPISVLCNYCWNQDKCLMEILKRNPPTTCFVYNLYNESNKNYYTAEQVTSIICETKCEARQHWVGDPVPHDKTYCDNYCPVSRYLLNQPKSDPDDVIRNGDI